MTQEYDTTTERKLWFSGAWGRSLPTSFLQFGPDCIACHYQLVFFRGTVYCYCFVTPENLEPIYLSLCDIRFFPEAQIENDGIASRQCQENIGQNQQITQEKT